MSKVIIRKTKKKDDEKNSKIYGVYMRSMLDKKVLLHINEIGRTLKSNLEETSANSNGCLTIILAVSRPK